MESKFWYVYEKGKKNTSATETCVSEERERWNEWMKKEKEESDKRHEEREGRSILGGNFEILNNGRG